MIRQPDFFASEKQGWVISIGFAAVQAKLLLKLQEEYGKIFVALGLCSKRRKFFRGEMFVKKGETMKQRIRRIAFLVSVCLLLSA